MVVGKAGRDLGKKIERANEAFCIGLAIYNYPGFNLQVAWPFIIRAWEIIHEKRYG